MLTPYPKTEKLWEKKVKRDVSEDQSFASEQEFFICNIGKN